MIVFDLCCDPHNHRFEGWFGSSRDFDEQQASGLIQCPLCGAAQVRKAPMAPAVPRKGSQRALTAPQSVNNAGPESSNSGAQSPAAPVAAALTEKQAVILQQLAEMQRQIIRQTRNVGDRFAEEARAMHYGEKEQAAIHGTASVRDAEELVEEGIAIMPLPFPVVPERRRN
jgi:hypothetical protein